jgi:hypothetical protein
MRTSIGGWPVNALGPYDDGLTNPADLSYSWPDCIKLMDPNGRSGPHQSERPRKTLKEGGFSVSRWIRIADQSAVSTTDVSVH